eukprot:727225-Pelagomonas_calceolata.AAC.9
MTGALALPIPRMALWMETSRCCLQRSSLPSTLTSCGSWCRSAGRRRGLQEGWGARDAKRWLRNGRNGWAGEQAKSKRCAAGGQPRSLFGLQHGGLMHGAASTQHATAMHVFRHQRGVFLASLCGLALLLFPLPGQMAREARKGQGAGTHRANS